jgi:DNA-binding response OmpR family regulator
LYLERAGYAVRVAFDGRQALELARAQRPDLVVLDLMLPHLDGLDVAHLLFEEVGRVPVIMLTARTTEADKLAGLELGADDYVTKPFSPRELVARVKAVLRRAEISRPRSESHFGRLTVDHARQEVRVGDDVVRVTPREFRVLEALAREPDRPFSRDSLVDRAFGFDYEGLERTVDAHVANLRRKIEPRPGHPIYVLTVPGVGYKLASEPAEEDAAPNDDDRRR